MQVRQCEKCGKIFENLAISICDACGADIPIIFKTIEKDTNLSDNALWYKQCPACGKWHKLTNKNDVTRWCENCGETAINNLGEDRVFNFYQYQRMIDSSANTQVLDNKESAEDIKESNTKIDSKPERKIRFVEMKNQNDGKVIRINPGKFILGALGDIESDYFYPLKYVSGKHLIVCVENEYVYIMDNNSRNKTRINGRVISKGEGMVEIHSNDKVTMADQTFEVMICK